MGLMRFAATLARGLIDEFVPDRGTAFFTRLRSIAAKVGVSVHKEDRRDRTVILGLGGQADGYFVFAKHEDDGEVVLFMFSQTHWHRHPPAVAHAVMERFNDATAGATYEVGSYESGRCRCQASTRFRSLDELTPSVFRDAVGEMAERMVTADKAFVEHGYA